MLRKLLPISVDTNPRRGDTSARSGTASQSGGLPNRPATHAHPLYFVNCGSTSHTNRETSGVPIVLHTYRPSRTGVSSADMTSHDGSGHIVRRGLPTRLNSAPFVG